MVHIDTPRLIADGPDVLVKAKLSGVQPSGTIRQRLPATYAPSAEAMNDSVFPIGLMLAMATGTPLSLSAPVSRSLIENSTEVQDIFTSWYPRKFQRVELRVEPREPRDTSSSSRTMSTFTAGVDSFYTLHRRFDEISTVLYVHGFDVPLKNSGVREMMSDNLRAAAQSAGKELVQGASNIRRFLNPHMTWSSMSHGAAIAGFASLLSDTHGKLYLPASYSYADLYPWGSHPLVDPKWSTDALGIVHEGAGAGRVEKTRAIAHEPSAQKHLRVCFQRDGSYNCGHCKKCVRTKTALELEGVLESFATFSEGLQPSEIEQLGAASESDYIFAKENLEFARSAQRDDIAEPLQSIIDTYLKKTA